jgi:hypothetical protein
MPKTNLIDLFEKAKTFNKFLILYLLRDKKPRSKEEIIDEIQSERQMFRNTILMAIDSLYINKLIIQTEINMNMFQNIIHRYKFWKLMRKLRKQAEKFKYTAIDLNNSMIRAARAGEMFRMAMLEYYNEFNTLEPPSEDILIRMIGGMLK